MIHKPKPLKVDKLSPFYQSRRARLKEYLLDKGEDLFCRATANFIKQIVATAKVVPAVVIVIGITNLFSYRAEYSCNMRDFVKYSSEGKTTAGEINEFWGVPVSGNPLQVKQDFTWGTPKICGLCMYEGKYTFNDTYFVPTYSSIPKGMPLSTPAHLRAMEKFLRTADGRAAFQAFLQASIDGLYQKHGLEGRGIRLGNEEQSRLKLILSHVGLLPFSIKIFGGSYLLNSSVALINEVDSEFHEVLHMISQPESLPMFMEMPIRLVYSMMKLKTPDMNHIDLAAMCPYTAFEEAKVGLLSSGYEDIVGILSGALMALEPQARKDMLDKFVLSTLHTASKEDERQAREFLNKALRQSQNK
jgi:hypothetical protein